MIICPDGKRQKLRASSTAAVSGTTIVLAAGLSAGLLLAACGDPAEPEEVVVSSMEADAEPEIDGLPIPLQSDWIDRGLVLSRGTAGEWDHLLYGGFAGSIIRKDDVFFLYYQGARSFSEQFQTVTDRAIGVATSRDGIHFEKYPRNPVVTWQPNGWLEEGAAAGTALIDTDGHILIYYGANTAINKRNVRADARVAISVDGFTFEDAGIVLGHGDADVWGQGDELFPIIGMRGLSGYYVYYLPNGSRMKGKLGVSWGSVRDRLSSSEAVSDPDGNLIAAWGMAGQVAIQPRLHAIFINDVRRSTLEVRLVDVDEPEQLGRPVRSYAFANMSQGILFRDSNTGIWYLYYRMQDGSGYGVRTARMSH